MIPSAGCSWARGRGRRRSVAVRLGIPLLAWFLSVHAGSAQDARTLPRVAFDDVMGERRVRERAFAGLEGVPIAVRLDLGSAIADEEMPAVDARVASLAGAGLHVWLRLGHLPRVHDQADVRRWRSLVRTLAERTRGQVQLVELPLAASSLEATPAELVYLLKLAAVQLRAVAPTLLVAVSGDRLAEPAWVDALYAADASPYVDVLSLPAGRATPVVIAALAGGLARLDADARIVIAGEPLAEVPAEARRIVTRTQLERLGSAAVSTTYTGSARAIDGAHAALVSMRELLADEIVALDEGGAGLSVTPVRPGGTVRARLLYNLATFSTYLAYWTDSAAAQEADVALRLPRAGPAMLRDPVTGGVGPPAAIVRDEETGVTRLRLTATGDPRLVDFDYGARNEFGLVERAVAGRSLTVQEIVARHQQVQAAQDDLLESYSARARMQQHFRPSVAETGYDVVTESRFFLGRDGVEWEEISFSVNGTKWGPDRPAFPLLQAEKVLALPLDIRLTADYTYRLEGVDILGSRPCYVVGFEPRSAGVSLYRGRVWIDRERFVRLKLQTVQTRLSSPIASNEEIQTFSPVTDAAGREYHLLSALTGRQLVLIAGRNLLVERDVRFWEFRVNDAGFDQLRRDARASDRIMYKETDRGLRYFVKEDGERRVSDRLTNRAKALAMGVTVDPAYAFPLPIVGLNYIDFDFGGPDTQLAVLFGGVLALGNIQRAKLFGGRVDASVDFFGIAVPGSDRVYDAEGERPTERVLNWPMNVGGNLGWQFTEFQKVGVQYVFRFDAYTRDSTTADDFQPPASTVTNGAGLAYEWRRAGFGLTAWSLWSRRANWRPWGPSEALEPAQPDYVKYSAGLSKDLYVGPFQKVHLNASYFGGERLDRFSQYQFGLFDDTRMHGVPSAGVRFGELMMARGSYAFNVFDQYRLELFLEHAVGRERAQRGPWDRLTGTGASFTMRAPFRTMLRGDIGKSFLPAQARSAGSVVVQVLLLKPL